MVSPMAGFVGDACAFAALPGDGFEEAEADEKANGGGEEDGAGVGGEAEGRTCGGGGHVESPWKIWKRARTRKKYAGAMAAEIF